MPFQQLMSVLPPVSAEAAGIPQAMRELMNQPFSPLVDFYPTDFGLDLNGKRFTWQAVILLPFIDEPRLVRILAPLLKRLTPNEKVRNRRGVEILFGHKEDKLLTTCVQLAQSAFESGQAGSKQSIRDIAGGLIGHLEGYQAGGMNRTITSPIEGLPDVEESHAISAQYFEPEHVPHFSKLLPGIFESKMVVNAADMDEAARLKGFGGEPARRMIMQALGRDPNAKPRYHQAQQPTPVVAEPVSAEPAAEAEEPAHWGDADAPEFEAPDDTEAAPAAPAPPPGTRVIKVHGKKNKVAPGKPVTKSE